MAFETLFVLLFGVATAVALLARRLRVPYTVALVIAGLALGTTHALDAPHLTKELLYAVFLPGLLFEAAFHLRFDKFWENKTAILALAVPGVIAATLLTALLLTPSAEALHFVTDFTLMQGLVFGALISATDPIAVVALFKSLGVPKRLAVLVEGESLLNDGTAAVIFSLLVAVVMGRGLSPAAAGLDFVRVVGLGLTIGLVVSFAVAKVIQQVDDPMIEITLTTIAGYGSFVLAEEFHVSGVIATVAAGMVCGNYAAHTGMSPSTRLAVESFWEYLAFALNSIVFLLIGFEVQVEALLASWEPILVAYLAVMLGRVVVIYVVAALLRRSRERLPWSWCSVLTWGGLRGGLSMVLALALPADFPHRELLVTMTFGVVVISILAQGLSMAPMLTRLGLSHQGAERQLRDTRRAALRAAHTAVQTLDRMAAERLALPEIIAGVRSEYEQRVREAEQALGAMHLAQSELREEELRDVRRQVLLAQKDQLKDALNHGLVGRDAFEHVLADVDAELLRLESGDAPPEAAADAAGAN